MRVLELFSGLGGLAAALAGRAEVEGAVDHDRRAADVYAASWPHPGAMQVKNLASVKTAWLQAFEADLWWMSPPCAPHGIRGEQADLDDPRSEAFTALLRHLAAIRPRWLALENVPWFADSRAHARLREVLADQGYAVDAVELCPTELGVPASRRRFCLVAHRDGPAVIPPPDLAAGAPRRLAEIVGPWREDLAVDPERLARFGDALHVVDPEDDLATAACFTRAYGKSPVYCGSYLRQRDPDGRSGLRHFAPEEIAALYGFPPMPALAALPPRFGWRLIGNSVSVQAVRHVLRGIPDLAR